MHDALTPNHNHIYIYDSTLRDGSQARGVDFTIADKMAICLAMTDLGIDYIEGGFLGSNPLDDKFFAEIATKHKEIGNSRIVPFGMTKRVGRSADNDPGLALLSQAQQNHICIVGKAWDFQVTDALGISLAENIDIIADSVRHLVGKNKEVIFDAEHFFDGYKDNAEYSLEVIRAAYNAGARWIALCDTNGGSMPDEIYEIISELTNHIPGSHLGIHCHNDTEQAVANSLAAVRAGVRQVQGTIGGIGERCGNANLSAIIPNLMLKMGYQTSITPDKLKNISKLNKLIDDRLNRPSNAHAAYVGDAAFAHKGGLHGSAMAKNSKLYEHIDPDLVGNSRQILVSDKAGRANFISRLKSLGVDFDDSSSEQSNKLVTLIETLKSRELAGYAYENADASFALLAQSILGELNEYYNLHSFRVIDERRWNAKKELVTLSEATVKLTIDNKRKMHVAEGNGPVNALDSALRSALSDVYPALKTIRLVDYKVRILSPEAGTEALTRVLIESSDDKGNRWCTVGVSPNVIDASYEALYDSICYVLFRLI